MNQSLTASIASEEVAAGMSDEEELRRWKLLHENTGIGEALTNGEYTNEFNELGLFEP